MTDSSDFTAINNKEISVLFVNTNVDADEIQPLNHYKLVDKHLYQLNKLTYICDDIIRYTLYDWLPVEIKMGCHSAVKHLCDAVDGIEKLIVKGE